ncbi:hypothetical protein MTO96_044793 [Rhipicephalus appendiculatus]
MVMKLFPRHESNVESLKLAGCHRFREKKSRSISGPRGGLDILKIGAPTVTTAIFAAAEISTEESMEDTVCPNPRQNIVVGLPGLWTPQPGSRTSMQPKVRLVRRSAPDCRQDMQGAIQDSVPGSQKKMGAAARRAESAHNDRLTVPGAPFKIEIPDQVPEPISEPIPEYGPARFQVNIPQKKRRYQNGELCRRGWGHLSRGIGYAPRS